VERGVALLKRGIMPGGLRLRVATQDRVGSAIGAQTARAAAFEAIGRPLRRFAHLISFSRQV
jgi:hypothetical protein